ncbi:MAG: hypothetical protein KatS3mg015_0798 [Fimbriimonadales bacterium]|nr:MAG: hypothetical protein KatS3mg015_0798 [Fimbriimonadales bacterium]
MKSRDLVERLYVWIACVLLVGGFGVHQWMLLQGRLAEWTARIAPTTLLVGWFLLGLGLLLAMWRREE